MLTMIYRGLILAVLAFFTTVAWAQTTDETRNLEGAALASQAADTLGVFEAESHEWDAVIKGAFKEAKAVFIVPALYKAGFFIGGEVGEGVLLARTADGSWSHPAFYRLFSASLGFQFGGQKSRHLLLVMSDKALQALQSNNFDLGGDVNVAAGTAGGSIERSTTTNLGVDVFSFSLGAGAYAGISLEGGKISYMQKLNDSFYDATDTTSQAIIDGQFSNSEADRLRSRVADYANE